MRFDSDILSATKRQALHATVVLLLDDAFEVLATSGELHESRLASYLPPRLERHYTESLHRGMLVALTTVGGQLASTDAPPLRCLAEELALHTIIEHAGVWLEIRGEHDEGWERYEDEVFEDTDFEFLYDPAWDGIESHESDVTRALGMANLHPDDWFKPFRTDQPVHPYHADV
jgi:hypothetical protein